MKKLIVSLIYMFLSLFIRRREDYVAIGSWKGELYIDNSRYLAEYINEHRKDIKIFWVGNRHLRQEIEKHINNVVFVEKNNFFDGLKLLKCKYMFFSQMHIPDISAFNVYRGAILCYLHHGFPVKRWADDGLNEVVLNKKGIDKLASVICGSLIKYNYFATSSPLQDLTNCTSLKSKGCTMDKNIHSGTPRNDIFFDLKKETILDLKQKYSMELGFSTDQRVIVYLPTYRRTDTYVFSFTKLDNKQRNEVGRILEKYNCIIIEKSHFAEKSTCDTTNNDEYIMGCTMNANVQEIMMFADILISDYSGAFLDFLFLDRPIIHYAYDYDYYKNKDSGLYYEIEDFSAGPVAYNFDELIRCIELTLQGVDSFSEKRKYVKDKYMSYECGRASEIIVNTVIGENTTKNGDSDEGFNT